jgi:hypothetical protein
MTAVHLGFSDNRGLAVFVLLVVIFRLLVIIVIVWLIWVSRRHRIANEVQPSETIFREALGHVRITRADPRRFRERLGCRQADGSLAMSDLTELGQDAIAAVSRGVADGAPLVKCQLLASAFYEALRHEEHRCY